MTRSISIIVLAGCLVGCGKQKTESPAPPAPTPAPAAAQSTTTAVSPAAPDAPPPPPPDAPVAAEAANATSGVPDSPREPVGEVTFPVSPEIRAALTKFFADNQRPATGWQDLIALHYIKSVPVGSDGKPVDWQKFMDAVAKASGR